MGTRNGTLRASLIALMSLILTIPAGPADAHEEREIGDLLVEVGWAVEPVYAGSANQVQMIVQKNGEAVEDARLEAEVIFGDPDGSARSGPIVLDPSFETPGDYLGSLIPTRPGTYTFHITGTVGGQTVDETFTSGEQTFDDVANPTEAQFPDQDPTNGELAQAIDRLSARVDEAGGGDSTALLVAIGSGVVALAALVLATRKRSG